MAWVVTGSKSFEPSRYWNSRLAEGIRLAATGTRPFGEYYQRYLYRLKDAAFRKLLKPYQHRLKGARVLNVGCGWGYFEPLFKELGAAEVTGVDFVSETIAELSRTRHEYEYIYANITKELPDVLKGRTFDLVTCIDVIYHIVDDDDFYQALRNMCELCDPHEGIFLWTDAPRRVNNSSHPHCRYHSFVDYQPVFERYGLQARATRSMYHLYDKYWSWSERVSKYPRVTYPLMYAFDRCVAGWGWRVDANVAALAVRAG